MSKWKDEAETNGQHSVQVPHWPRVCRTKDCQRDTDVAFIIVEDESGKRRAGAFSQFGYVKKAKVHGNKDTWLLKDGFRFIEWHSYCAECNLDRAERQKVAQMEQPGRIE